MKVHINIAKDKSAGISLHMWFPIPVAVLFIPAIEMYVPMHRGQPANKLTSTVKHKGQTIVQDGHDCGRFIHDITIIPVNAYYPFIWPASSRKIAFAASTVQMQSQAAACADLFASLPLPMMTCGDPVTSPIGLPLTNSANTVFVGASISDIIAGILTIMFTMLGDILSFLLSVLSGGEIKSGFAWEIIKGMLDRLFPMFSISSLLKWLVGVLGGISISIGRWADSDRKGPLQISVPGPFPESPSVTFTYDPATGRWNVTLNTPALPAPATPSKPAPPAPPSSTPEHGSFGFMNTMNPLDDMDFGHSLEPPDDRAGWEYNPNQGWVIV